MKRLVMLVLLLTSLFLLVSAPGAVAGKSHGGKVVTPQPTDPGDGGGGYPLWTGICRLTGGQYNEGFSYIWPGNERWDKCHDGWYTVETWNGSAWVLGAYYD